MSNIFELKQINILFLTFFLCSSLVSIYIPINVATIGIEAFNYCSGLKAINCQVSKQLDSWSKDWCKGCDCVVKWDADNANNK